MSDRLNWEEGNNNYLSAAIIWLRLKLERKLSKPLTLPKAITDIDVAKAATTKLAAEALESPPALITLSKLFELSRFEQDVLLLCVAIELDTRIATICAHVHDDPNKPYPTFSLALAIFDEPSWDVMSPERPLLYWRLIEINQSSTHSLTHSHLIADPRIVNYVKGLNYIDERLASLLAPLQSYTTETELPPSQQDLAKKIIRRWQQTNTSSSIPVIQLVGPDSPSKQQVADYIARKYNRHLYRMTIEMLPTQTADLELLSRLWKRESILLPLALYLDAQEIESPASAEGPRSSQIASTINRFLTFGEGIYFVGTREVWSHLGVANQAFHVSKPTKREQQSAWLMELGNTASDSSALLASQFDLNLTTIHQIAQTVINDLEEDRENLLELLWDACRVYTSTRLDRLAQRVEPKVTWDDLVLPAKEMNLLHQIVDQMMQRSRVYEDWGFASRMNRGLGINALFAGESGTGKTMAAEVLANHLHLNLYRIDVSAMLSKSIGETEKNLRRLVDAAEDGGCILLFDKADSFLGQSSAVKDSHNHNNDIDITYLLQRLEDYHGLTLIETNMRSALDTSFKRYFRFVIDFPFPDFIERKRIWQNAFPPQTPIEPFDYDQLARFKLTGARINSIAINATFFAAQAATAVRMSQLLEAAQDESSKLSQPVAQISSSHTSATLSEQIIKNDLNDRPPRTRAFISYSHKDKRYLQELQVHLTHYIRKENLDVWDDTKIPPGSKWGEEIANALQSVRVAVLLISADFLASDFITNNELPPLLAAAKQEGAIILPVILRSSAFKDTDLAHFKAVNAPSNPLSNMTPGKRDEVWNKVAEQVRDALS